MGPLYADDHVGDGNGYGGETGAAVRAVDAVVVVVSSAATRRLSEGRGGVTEGDGDGNGRVPAAAEADGSKPGECAASVYFCWC